MNWQQIIKAQVSEWLITIKTGKGAGPQRRERFIGTKQESKEEVKRLQDKDPPSRITIRRISKK